MSSLHKSKILFVLFFAFHFAENSFAVGSFQEKQNDVSVGYGFGTFLGALFNDYDTRENYSFSLLGPVYAKYEYGITGKIGLGLNCAYASYDLNYDYGGFTSNGNPVTYRETDNFTTFSVLARFNFHFGNLEKFDPYIGVGVGYRSGTWKYSSTEPGHVNTTGLRNVIPFGFETTFGARYFFARNIGLYAETGMAKSVVQFGVLAKF